MGVELEPGDRHPVLAELGTGTTKALLPEAELTWAFTLEQVRRIELPYSAWDADQEGRR